MYFKSAKIGGTQYGEEKKYFVCLFQKVIDPRLPFVILASGSFLGASISLFLPETAGVDLPDTAQEAEQFGKGQKFLLLPCIEERKAKKVLRDSSANTMLETV